MKKTMNFAAKTALFALFALLLFGGRIFAADCNPNNGCHQNGNTTGTKCNGCDTSASGLYVSTPYKEPNFAPAWTEITSGALGRVRGGQYIKFSVVEGEVYVWSTEGKEDVFYGSYAQSCQNDSNCRTASDTTEKGLRCIGSDAQGKTCRLPFDTELTLLKGEVCSDSAEFLAYSNSGGFRNQSSLEWKATFTGTVVLLVTNNAYEDAVDMFVGCSKTSSDMSQTGGIDMTTTVKWQRSSSSYCSTCGDKTKYRTVNTHDAKQAPLWTTVQSRTAVTLTDFLTPIDNGNQYGSRPNDLWLKPGSYVVFTVTENQIYRWSTCIADFQDTQLTLFKGDQGGTGTDGKDCGQVLAYGDDSKISYSSAKRLEQNPTTGQITEVDDDAADHLVTYCPAGTKQTVIEWKANFSGAVTLLLNEYNCYQCYPQELPVSGGITDNRWLNCFYEVTGNFQTVDTSTGIQFKMENGWPVEAGAGDAGLPGSFVYPFPLDWQRYDCNTCEAGSTPSAKIDGYNPTPTGGWTAFGSGSNVTLPAGKHAVFSLKRGSKYLFSTNDPNAIITIKKGESCDGELVDQATGQLAYFADSEAEQAASGTYGYMADKISVFVSKADCRAGSASNVLKYEYYTTSGNIDARFTENNVAGSDSIVTDNSTTHQFVDTTEWAHSWEEAIKVCQDKKIGEGGSSDIIPCPDPICPSGSYELQAGYFCKYVSSAVDGSGNCLPPVCPTNYSELQKNVAGNGTILNPEDEDLWGKCYYSGSQCDRTEQVTVGTASYYTRPVHGCNDGDEYVAVKVKCAHCDQGTLFNKGSSTKPNYICVETQCMTTQQCITIGGGCSDIGAEESCPEGYTYNSYHQKCFDPAGAVPIYGSPASSVDATASAGTGIGYTSPEGATGCPSGMHELSDGTCEYDTCGQYAEYTDFISKNGKFILKKLLDEDPVACYLSTDKSGGKVPCCCSTPIKKFKGTTIQTTYEAGEMYYATALFNNAVQSYDQWKCQQPGDNPCPGGQYIASINQCVKCTNPGDVLFQRNANLFGCRADCGENYIITNDDPPDQKCMTCTGADQYLVMNGHSSAKCVTCGEGRTAVSDGNGGYLCVLDEDQCSDSDHVVVELTDGMSCAPAVPGGLQCKEGWVEVSGKCRKLSLKSNGSYESVKCTNTACTSSGNPAACLAPNASGRTCDPDNPNSFDCHCYVDRCEDSTQLVDKKVCEDARTHEACKYVCSNGANPSYNAFLNKYYCGGNTPATCLTLSPVEVTTTLNGASVTVVKECKYTDATGQTCGEAMGGWTLPNINQLYSIVDFDLYDPATAYPFQEGYIRDEDDEDCHPIPHPETMTSCSADGDCDTAAGHICIGGKCASPDPYGDNQCADGDGSYICQDNRCVRNNWFWSSTTVVSEGANNGKFVWAVNMEDGRSYYAAKGCSGTDCLTKVDLSARPHHVLCVKGSTVAGIFDSDAPTYDQTFSGWACDKDYPQVPLTIYFEIKDTNGKDMVAFLGSEAAAGAEDIPGLNMKGIKYGPSDDSMITTAKENEIYNNCGFGNAGDNHAFGVLWMEGNVTAGHEGVAEILAQIAEKECETARISDTSDTKTDCGVPPYFVTAYGVNESSSSGASAVAISPTERPFVFKNRCGDGYKTYDGDFTETCESENFEGFCAYGNDSCQLCAETDMTVNGTEVKACTYYNANPPKCNDGTLQSYYCVDASTGEALHENGEPGVIADGHTGTGLACEYYNFMASNSVSSTEECDCNAGGYPFYYYADQNNFVCDSSYGLTQNVCPDYNTVPNNEFDPTDPSNYCYICAGCKKSKTAKARCGDNKIQRANCTGYTNCETVPGADEECDDGNSSDTDTCTNNCKLATCGDGHIQPALGEICDSGLYNGWYATNCDGTQSCPGCAGWNCGKEDTEELGPHCGDGKIQHRTMCTNTTMLEAAGYSTFDEFYADNHFANASECQQKLTGAAEVCDLGEDAEGNSLNGRPVAFEAFLQTAEGANCAAQIEPGGQWYPVNAIHANYLECVYKYREFLNTNAGCAANCESKEAPFCGDGIVGEGEICDNGIPEVHLVDGKYVLDSTSAGKNYNGVGYRSDSCRLDCKARYNCNNNVIETEDCAGMTPEGFCPSIGGGGILFVRGATEACDDGSNNGVYGFCAKGCQKQAYCGSGGGNDVTKLDCIEYSGDSCLRREECDFGRTGDAPNKTVEAAYSKEKGLSCIAEDPNICAGAESTWGDTICCKHGRYCGDGTVDSGLKVGDSINWTGRTVTGSGIDAVITYSPADYWTVNGATVAYDTHSMAIRFEMTAAAATAELNVAIPIDLDLRYFLEYNVMPITNGVESISFLAGVNEYSESDALLTSSTYANASPYFFTETEGTSNGWYRGKNVRPIKGEGYGDDWKWYAGTRKVRVYFEMSGAVGTQFLVRALSFYDMENANYSGEAMAREMCDPGEENFATTSSSYMTDCNSECQWINYCGDGTVQRGSCDSEGKYNGYPCASGIQYAAEVCDNGSNSANVYNGCEPGCLELGPHCGDGYTDMQSCPANSESWCHIPNGSFGGVFVPEKCDNGGLNSNNALCTGAACAVSDLKDYGACREDCRPARCGDGILDNVVDASGNPVEECDCGAVGAYFEGITDQQITNVNGQTYYLCLKDDGTHLYNTITAQRAALCRPNCKISRCGDGIKDDKEDCDDGNFNDYDSCTNKCKFNEVGDGILAHSRSYLCEELKNLDEATMKKMRDKGVVDCVDSGSTMTCAQLASILTSDNAITTYFESGVLHCCFNQKLNGGNNDRNCERMLDGEYKTPKDIAVKRCETYAENVSADGLTMNGYKSHEDCVALEAQGGMYAAWEQCESCKNATCGQSCESGDTECQNRRQRNCETKYTDADDINDCIVKNTYCNEKGWNIIGSCGDGQVNTAAGEICDNNITEEDRYYIDLYGHKVGFSDNWHYTDAEGKWYDGHYCTGPCRGTCDNTKRICENASDDNCWTEGCTVTLHRSSNNEYNSTCGDGFLDVYAGEECDYGVNSHSYDWNESYCNPKCKKNREGGIPTAPVAKCGDGQRQSDNEQCDDGNEADDDYCVGDGVADANGYVNHCKTSFGTCGDGKIRGHIISGSNVNALALYDSLIPETTLTAAGHTKEGPEDCDTEDERTKSLVNAGLDVDNLCGTANSKQCQRIGACGDGIPNPRFESCDFGAGNATQNKTLNGKTCYAGCKSDPKGGIIKATNSEINGWACDPDHPMVHPDTLVVIKIYDVNGAFVGQKNLKTTKDVKGTDYFGNIVNPSSDPGFTTRECGGGSTHGWTYDPSQSDDAMNWTSKVPPYTVKAYARSLDGEPETAEVFIGEKTFVSALRCGDAYVSTCSSIEVTKLVPTVWAAGNVCNDDEVEGECSDYDLVNGEACANSDGFNCADITVNKLATVSWDTTTVCKDEEVLGECSDYGLTANKKCVDEQCDDGTNNGNLKDCDANCQWTSCGDGTIQTQATGTRPDHVSEEECEGTTDSRACSTLLNGTQDDGLATHTDVINGTAYCSGTSDPKCKWRRASCQIKSKCPALVDAITSAWNYTDASGTHTYKPENSPANASLFIKRNSNGAEEYFRSWNGTDWGTRETTAVYKGNATAGTPQATCSFECVDKFEWDGTRCKPKTNITLSCPKCTNEPHGVWSGTNNPCQTTDKQIPQTINVNSDGTVSTTPQSANLQYNTSASSTSCNWSCDSDSHYNGSKCLVTAKTFTCTGKPANTKWLPVNFAADGSYTVGTPTDTLTIDQTISGSGTNWNYYPSDANLAATDVNNASQSPNQLKGNGTAAAEVAINGPGPLRCYYTCANGTSYDAATGTCKAATCGDGVTNHETCIGISGTCYITQGRDELCDDNNSYNGQYKASGTTSYCDKFCGSYKVCMANYCGTNSDGSYKTCDSGTTNCKFIKASGYNGRIGRVSNASTQATDGKYYCGDAKTQFKSGTCVGDDCDLVNAANYPGAKVDSYNNSEKCDKGYNYDVQTLCEKALGVGHTYYKYNSSASNPSCSSDCSSITNATAKTGCNYCGDGEIGGSENCENTSDGTIKFSDNTTFDKTLKKWSYTAGASSTLTVPVSGVYKITVKGGKGGDGYKTATSAGSGADGCGGTGAGGGVVSAQYYLAKGTTLTYKAANVGQGATSGGNPRCDHRQQAGASGGSGCASGSTGGTGGTGCHGVFGCSDYTAGGGGGGGGSSCVKIGSTTLVSAYGGGGGGGGGKGGNLSSSDGTDGGNGSGSTGGAAGSGAGSYGHDGGKGGNGGGSNDYYSSTSGTSYYFVSGTASTSGSNAGGGTIEIELVKYHPCKNDTCQTDTSSYVNAGSSKTACTGLPANAEWNSVSEITQTWSGSAWSPSSTAGTYNATASTTECRFKCKTNYYWDSSTSQCINVRNASCGTLPANAEWNTVSSITQTYTTAGGWSPATTQSYNETPTTTACRFKCKSTHTWNGSACVNTRTVSCPALPSGAVYNTASSITQNWTPAGGWQPSNELTYNTTPATNACHYKCNTHYTWTNNSYCKADSNSANCTGLPTNAQWNTVSSITQTWNGNTWTPSNTGVYNINPSNSECRYKCKDGFHTENGGTTCISNTKTHSCGSLPANAEWNTVSSYQQTWNNSTSSWTPAATTLTHNDTASTTACRFKCKSGYTYENGACINTKTTSCGTLPSGGVANTATSITQTWNASTSSWTPAATWTHSDSPSTARCYYKCDTNYYWTGSQCARLKWGFENSSDTPPSSPLISSVSNNNWTTENYGSVGAHAGSKSMCSNNQASANSTATITYTINMPEEGLVSFYAGGSSESGYDYFRIKVDGSEKLSSNGVTIWTKYIYYLTAGTHTLELSYSKDGSKDVGTDKYCIDDLELKLGVSIGGTWNVEDDNYNLYNFINAINYNSNSTYAWSRMNSSVGTYSGSYALCSGNYNVSSSNSTMTITVNPPVAGTISFYLKGKSESTSYDYLTLTLDGSQQFKTADVSSWTKYTYHLTAGTHTLVFYYVKDNSVNTGDDRFCIDDIAFVTD